MYVIYCLLVVIGVIAVAVVLYTLIMTGRCQFWSPHPEETSPARMRSARLNLIPYSVYTFRYKKQAEDVEATSQSECVVCLTGFEDEESVQQLPECRHSFHSPCIDMWMHSHSDCPICRTPVSRIDSVSDSRRNSIANLSGISINSS